RRNLSGRSRGRGRCRRARCRLRRSAFNRPRSTHSPPHRRSRDLRRLSRQVPDQGDFRRLGSYGFYDAYLERFLAEARWSMKLKRVAVRVPADIGAAIKDFASEAGGGLVVMVDAFNVINQATIRRALQDCPLPHIVPWRSFVVSGGLMSYGP